ncbi:MAG: glycosyltransferase family 39 protein [bacterium]
MWQDFVLAEKTIKQKTLLLVVVFAIILVNYIPLSKASLIDWDEGVFALQSQWLASFGMQGKPFNFQTPPLYQMLVAGLFCIFGSKTFILHLIALIASCFGVYLVFRLTSLLSSINDAIIAVLLFATTEFFLFFAKSGLSDAVFLCFFLASVLYFFKGMKENKDAHFLCAGLFLALAAYTKYSAFPLFISFLVIGLMDKKKINTKWFFFSIILPIILFVPYVLLMLRFIEFREISTRHLSFLGLNHFKFLVFLLIFAPSVLFLSLTHLLRNIKNMEKWNVYIFVTILIFFLMLGFYYPYFRLAYPIVPLLAIPGAQFIGNLRKYKTLITLVFILISLAFGFQTIKYLSTVPEKTGNFVHDIAVEADAEFIYAVVPPNILYYIDFEVVVPQGHPWELAGKMNPGFNKHKRIIKPDDICLPPNGKTILVHATALDEIKKDYSNLYDKGILISSFYFLDAPVYYKDVYNPQRNIQQLYEVYIIDNAAFGEQLGDLWLFGFDRRVTVMFRR